MFLTMFPIDFFQLLNFIFDIKRFATCENSEYKQWGQKGARHTCLSSSHLEYSVLSDLFMICPVEADQINN